MKAPQHLKHKPIIAVNDYDEKDGPNANDTDAMALSIGEAQYDKDIVNRSQISLKVWRRPENRWSCQSEEIPLHRNIDLNILLIGVLLTSTIPNSPTTSLNEEVIDKEKVGKIWDYYKANEEFLNPRLVELRDKLNNFIEINNINNNV
jgi:hypothetical protein